MEQCEEGGCHRVAALQSSGLTPFEKGHSAEKAGWGILESWEIDACSTRSGGPGELVRSAQMEAVTFME